MLNILSLCFFYEFKIFLIEDFSQIMTEGGGHQISNISPNGLFSLLVDTSQNWVQCQRFVKFSKTFIAGHSNCLTNWLY